MLIIKEVCALLVLYFFTWHEISDACLFFQQRCWQLNCKLLLYESSYHYHLLCCSCSQNTSFETPLTRGWESGINPARRDFLCRHALLQHTTHPLLVHSDRYSALCRPGLPIAMKTISTNGELMRPCNSLSSIMRWCIVELSFRRKILHSVVPLKCAQLRNDWWRCKADVTAARTSINLHD